LNEQQRLVEIKQELGIILFEEIEEITEIDKIFWSLLPDISKKNARDFIEKKVDDSSDMLASTDTSNQ